MCANEIILDLVRTLYNSGIGQLSETRLTEQHVVPLLLTYEVGPRIALGIPLNRFQMYSPGPPSESSNCLT